jgi:RNA polymerase sigma factor (sigma-70 family)
MDNEEFERMYAECRSALQRLCRYKLPSKTDGDDVLQDTALTAWANRSNVKNTESFKPWIFRIAVNKCNDFYRKRARSQDVPLDELTEQTEFRLAQTRYGMTVEETVTETLDALGDTDSQILTLFYLRDIPQAEIAWQLNIPLGTVKSRLNAARKRFRSEYPSPPQTKGDLFMGKLPRLLPEYKITAAGEAPFECVWEELMGWFLVPRLGEKLSWAIYDQPERKMTGGCAMEVTGEAIVHGLRGVSVVAVPNKSDGGVTREFVAQLTDSHSRFLSESHMKDGVKHLYTFLDSDAFLNNWGFGEDNCGNDIRPKRKGIITRCGSDITCPDEKFVIDVIDRCVVTINGREYNTIRLMDIECYNSGMVVEQYIGRDGRTVLWRRFNRDDWHFSFYKQKWSEKLPDNERLTINGETYVHWYDCITDHIC